MSKKPSFQFYPGDWRKDQNLSRASLEAKGAMIDIMCLAFESEKRGRLITDKKPWTIEEIAYAMGGDKEKNTKAIDELLKLKVLKIDSKKTIYSARMVRDEKIAKIRRAAGSEGGNPKLVTNYNKPGFVYFIRRRSDNAIKIGIAINPTNRLYKLRQKHKSDPLELVKYFFVSDMGKCENELHLLYDNKKVIGEWFKINELEIEKAESTLKGNSKQNPTPSSSTSSSTSVLSINKRFEFDLKTVIPDNVLTSAEMNQFTMTGKKHTNFIKSQWFVFISERMNEEPKKYYPNISEFSSHFLNWIRNKHPKPYLSDTAESNDAPNKPARLKTINS